MTTKVCSKCRVEKDLGEFYKNRRAADALTHRCKACALSCTAKYRAENLEKEKARKAKYYAENPEKLKASFARWCVENQEKVRAKSAKHTNTLTNYYVRSKLRIPNPPQELIELKRLQLQIIREIKQQGK